MGKGAKSVPDRNLTNEYQQTLKAQASVMPQYIALEQQYAPQQTALMGKLQNQAAGQAVISMEQYSPALQNIYNQSQQQAIAGNPLYSSMYNQAINQVNMGSSLSPADEYYASQQALTGLSDRGMAGSNQGVIDAIFGRSQYAQQMLNSRLAMGSSVMSQMPGATGYNTASGLFSGASYGGLSNYNVNPESGYAQDVYSSNQNKQVAQANQKSNFMGGIIGGTLGAVGNIFKPKV